MTDGAAVAARLRQLAARARTGGGGTGTAGLAVALDRRRRQRAGRGVAVVLAVLVLGTAATLARPADVTPAAAPPLPADVTFAGQAPGVVVRGAAPAPARPLSAPPVLYEQPARGSLAGDADFVTGVAALPWSALPDPDTGDPWDVDPDSRRVVYAADVPGGHRWAVVLARWRGQWAVDWFSGPTGASPAELSEADVPTTYSPTQPLGLMDVSAPTGPLLLLAAPGVSAEWSPSLDRAPDGRLVRVSTPLPVVDGAVLGEVPTPVGWNAGELVQVREGVRSPVPDLRFTGDAAWYPVRRSDAPPDDALFAACLTAHGFDVQEPLDSPGVSWSDPRESELTSLESAARLAEVLGCQDGATG